jgi:membrane protease YdiL (CAAX protease family)
MEETDRPSKNRRVGYGPIAAILVTVGVYFASQLLVGLAVSLIPLFNGWSEQRLESWLSDSVPVQFVTVLLVEAATLWLLWRFMKIRQVGVRAIGLVKPQVRDIGYAVAGYMVYFALFIAISVIAKALIPELNLDQEQEIGFSKSIAGPALSVVFISLVILPPLTEEIVARGFLYTGLRNKLPKITAALITSVLFAAAHLQWGSGVALLWVAALDTFVLSLVLVYLREKTGSLWSPILVHMLKNGLAFSLLFIFKVT